MSQSLGIDALNEKITCVAASYTDEDPEVLTPQGGLTKREYFAVMAMQGMLANPTSTNKLYDESIPYSVQCANASVIMADALITSLNKPAE